MKKQKDFFHYRNAFKSDHLASADIEELQENNNGVAILTITKIEYFENRTVAGRKVPKCLVASFLEKNNRGEATKPMVVNSGNSKIIAKFIGSSNVHEWGNLNLKIELYVNHNVKLSGQIVGGIRIKTVRPVATKPVLKDEDIVKAAKWVNESEKHTIEGLKKIKTVSKHQETEIKKLLNTSK